MLKLEIQASGDAADRDEIVRVVKAALSTVLMYEGGTDRWDNVVVSWKWEER